MHTPILFWKTALNTLLAALLVAPLHAAVNARALADLSIEELMNESVTSVSKKEQRLADVASAVTVLSNDDLRRSGASSIAEALRLVPGLNVASVNSREWAISARGFQNVYANKLLVLVDGRSVYTPIFSGVFWDLQQTMLEDVDRIEVIRGPGATVWGANALSGVINIATRSAKDTQGGLLSVGGGNDGTTAGVRYGGRAGEHAYYRVFASQLAREHHSLTGGRSAMDDWKGWHGGVQVDSYPQAGTHVTWQAGATSARLDNGTTEGLNLNTLARWTRQLAPASSIQAQVYFDRDHHDETVRARTTVTTSDFSLHHRLALGGRHDVIWGVGYRHMDTILAQVSPFVRVLDRSFGLQVFSAFAQDEIKLVPEKLNLTVGTKLEHNDFTGWELQPTARLVLKPSDRQSVWAAISRAVRTPSVVEGREAFSLTIGPPFPGPAGGVYVPALVGNPAVKSNTLVAFEVGYRAQISSQVSFDLTAFRQEYRDGIDSGSVTRLLPGRPVGVAEIPWVNVGKGYHHGTEIAFNVSPSKTWRLIATYTLLKGRFQRPGPIGTGLETGSPEQQAMLRSSHDVTKHLGIDAQLRYVSGIFGVPAYVEADLRLSYRVRDGLELSIIGKNLLDPQHPEQARTAFAATAEVPRRVSGRVTWRF